MASVVARIWSSLKLVSKAEPRWPEVPKLTRWAGMAGSGFFSKYAGISAATSSFSVGGTSVPAVGSMVMASPGGKWLTLRQAQGEDLQYILMLSLSKHEDTERTPSGNARIFPAMGAANGLAQARL